jgi:NADH:ubiquinone oxidoreductase subunit E
MTAKRESNAPGLAEILAPYRTGRLKGPSRTGVSQTPPNILSCLLAVQEALRCVPPGAIPEIARSLDVTEADVAGVLSYYPDLHTGRPGRHVIRVCTGESCVANHCAQWLASLQDRLKIRVGETTPDGRFTLERVYCVGNCAVGPSLMIDEDVYGRVEAADVARLLDSYR